MRPRNRLQRRFHPPAFALLACGALFVGCGDAVSVLAGGADVSAKAPGDGAVSDDAMTDVTVADTADIGPADATSDTNDASDANDASDTNDASDATADAGIDVPSDTVPTDTGPADTGPADTTPMDTSPVDTGPMDTSPEDTGPMDTGPMDTGPLDVGMPDVPPVDVGPTLIRGHRATSLISAGSVMTSRSYRMVSTLGQPTIHQTSLRSASFRLRGGLIGASSGSR